MQNNSIIVKVEDIHKSFQLHNGFKEKLISGDRTNSKSMALDGVTFELRENETLGIVGESGCGKTTLARIILGLSRPDAGRVELFGFDVHTAEVSERNYFRRHARMIFQSPDAVLNPYMIIGDALDEILKLHTDYNRNTRKEKIQACLQEVGLLPDYVSKYPHELSGGEKRRVTFARAVILDNRLIVADEPVAALDATIRSDLIEKIRRYQNEHSTAFIIISHDIGIIKKLCDRIAVMRRGKIVEMGKTENFNLESVKHSYTKHLIRCDLT